MTEFQMAKQEQPHWCWAAVTTSVFGYFYPDKPLSQQELANDVSGGRDIAEDLNTAFAKARRELRKRLNLDFLSDTHLAFDHVQAQIDSGLPVCVALQWFDGPEGHFVVISGYSISLNGDAWLEIADPFYGDTVTPYDVFLSAYQGAGHWIATYLVGEQ